MSDSAGSQTAMLYVPGLLSSMKENPIREEIERRNEEVEKNIKEESTTSDSEVSSNENEWWVGKKLLVTSKEIGKSGGGTVVYEAFYEGKSAAVKRLPKSHLRVDYKEIELVKNYGHHPNIVKYVGDEQDRDFVYLVLERCICNLDDIMQIHSTDHQYEVVYNDLDCSMSSVTLFKEDRLELLKNTLKGFKLYNEKNGRPLPLLRKLIRDVVFGLVHLHKLGIVHRDLKPQNILITKEGSTLCAKLSDMGISRCLVEDKSSLSNHFTGCGTTGWKAPEKLRYGRQTRKMDMFGLGCIVFFCITGGRHPYGNHDERDANIKINNKKNMYLVQDFPEAYCVISALLDGDPEKRPTAIEVLNDPLLWDEKKRLHFLCDASDRVRENSDLIKALECTAHSVLGTKEKWLRKVVLKWNKNVDDKIIQQMRPYMRGGYNFSSVRDLLQLIRNVLNNYEHLPEHIQTLVGPLYEGLDDYFTRPFPMLLIEVYKLVCTYCKEEECFRKYFKENL